MSSVRLQFGFIETTYRHWVVPEGQFLDLVAGSCTFMETVSTMWSVKGLDKSCPQQSVDGSTCLSASLKECGRSLCRRMMWSSSDNLDRPQTLTIPLCCSSSNFCATQLPRKDASRSSKPERLLRSLEGRSSIHFISQQLNSWSDHYLRSVEDSFWSGLRTSKFALGCSVKTYRYVFSWNLRQDRETLRQKWRSWRLRPFVARRWSRRGKPHCSRDIFSLFQRFYSS